MTDLTDTVPAAIQSHHEDKEFQCELCHYETNDRSNFRKHTTSITHRTKELAINNNTNNTASPITTSACSFCDYSTANKSNLKRHIVLMHLGRKQVIAASTRPSVWQCGCGKSYETQSGLYKHRQKCPTANSTPTPTIVTPAHIDLIVMMKEVVGAYTASSQELIKQLVLLNEKTGSIEQNQTELQSGE